MTKSLRMNVDPRGSGIAMTLATALLGASLFAMYGAAAESGPEQCVAAIMASWNTHDMHAYASQFTEDATFVNVNGWWLLGRKDIEAQHVRAHAGNFKNSHAEIKPQDVRFLRPDVAIVQASWTITGDLRDPQPRDYLMTIVSVKRDASWLILAAQNGSALNRSALPSRSVAWILSPLPKDAQQTAPEGVRSLLAESDSAWGRGDAKSSSEHFAEDADLVDVSARSHSGALKIREHIADQLALSLQGTSSRSTILTSNSVSGDLVVAEIRREFQGGALAAPLTITGLRVFTRASGRWRIAAAQDTITRALPSPTQ